MTKSYTVSTIATFQSESTLVKYTNVPEAEDDPTLCPEKGTDIYFYDSNPNGELDKADKKIRVNWKGTPLPIVNETGKELPKEQLPTACMEEDEVKEIPITQTDIKTFGAEVGKLFKQAQEEKKTISTLESILKGGKQGWCQRGVTFDNSSDYVTWEERDFKPAFSISTRLTSPTYDDASVPKKGKPVDPARCISASSTIQASIPKVNLVGEITIVIGIGAFVDGPTPEISDKVLSKLGLKDENLPDIFYEDDQKLKRAHFDLKK